MFVFVEGYALQYHIMVANKTRKSSQCGSASYLTNIQTQTPDPFIFGSSDWCLKLGKLRHLSSTGGYTSHEKNNLEIQNVMENLPSPANKGY